MNEEEYLKTLGHKNGEPIIDEFNNFEVGEDLKVTTHNQLKTDLEFQLLEFEKYIMSTNMSLYTMYKLAFKVFKGAFMITETKKGLEEGIKVLHLCNTISDFAKNHSEINIDEDLENLIFGYLYGIKEVYYERI